MMLLTYRTSHASGDGRPTATLKPCEMRGTSSPTGLCDNAPSSERSKGQDSERVWLVEFQIKPGRVPTEVHLSCTHPAHCCRSSPYGRTHPGDTRSTMGCLLGPIRIPSPWRRQLLRSRHSGSSAARNRSQSDSFMETGGDRSVGETENRNIGQNHWGISTIWNPQPTRTDPPDPQWTPS